MCSLMYNEVSSSGNQDITPYKIHRQTPIGELRTGIFNKFSVTFHLGQRCSFSFQYV